MSEAGVDRNSLVKYYSEVALKAEFNEAVNTWGYDEAFLRQCNFENFGNLFTIACGGGCPLRLENELPRKGYHVVDLGCGAGHDVIIAARLVGETGKVIGVDITPAMLEKTQQNIDRFRKPGDAPIELMVGVVDTPNSLEQIPNEWADLVISNGAFNLFENKPAAFAAVYRILKPGGRFHLSDVVEDPEAMAIAARTGCSGDSAPACSLRTKEETCELPFNVPGGVTVEGWNDWVSGCVPPEEYVKLMGEAGFDGARCVGAGEFWTSPTTRTMNFVGVKSLNSLAAVRTPRIKHQYLLFAGVAVVLALTMTRFWSKRS